MTLTGPCTCIRNQIITLLTLFPSREGGPEPGPGGGGPDGGGPEGGGPDGGGPEEGRPDGGGPPLGGAPRDDGGC